MRFEPKTEEELSSCLPDGIYDFAVQGAEEKTSKKGNEMIELLLTIYDDAGSRQPSLKDWLVSSEGGIKKIRGFCSAVGLLALYESGGLSDDHCVNKTGKVAIGVEEQEGGYPPRNYVKYYVKSGATPPVPESAGASTGQRRVDNSAPFPDPNAKQAAAADPDIPF